MKSLFVLSLFLSTAFAHAEDMKPIRMASVHGTIHRQIVNRGDGYEDVVSNPLCQFIAEIPVYDIRKAEDFSTSAVVATCESTVNGVPVAVRLVGKVTLEDWGNKDVKGAEFILRTMAAPGKAVTLPRAVNGYVGTRDLTARNLMIYMDPTGWNGDEQAPMQQELFAATVEVDDNQ